MSFVEIGGDEDGLSRIARQCQRDCRCRSQTVIFREGKQFVGVLPRQTPVTNQRFAERARGFESRNQLLLARPLASINPAARQFSRFNEMPGEGGGLRYTKEHGGPVCGLSFQCVCLALHSRQIPPQKSNIVES
jgi:hypothetical protein